MECPPSSNRRLDRREKTGDDGMMDGNVSNEVGNRAADGWKDG